MILTIGYGLWTSGSEVDLVEILFVRNGEIVISHLRRPIEGITDPDLYIVEYQSFILDPYTCTDRAGKTVAEYIVIVAQPSGVSE